MQKVFVRCRPVHTVRGLHQEAVIEDHLRDGTSRSGIRALPSNVPIAVSVKHALFDDEVVSTCASAAFSGLGKILCSTPRPSSGDTHESYLRRGTRSRSDSSVLAFQIVAISPREAPAVPL